MCERSRIGTLLRLHARFANGFAARAIDHQGDLPAELRILGNVRAGQVFEGVISAGGRARS
jgi:molybdopterin biosynthesis enzyme